MKEFPSLRWLTSAYYQVPGWVPGVLPRDKSNSPHFLCFNVRHMNATPHKCISFLLPQNVVCVQESKKGDTWPVMRLEGCKKERSIKHFIYRASFRPHLCLTSRGESTCHQNNSWFQLTKNNFYEKFQLISANFLKIWSINLKTGAIKNLIL